MSFQNCKNINVYYINLNKTAYILAVIICDEVMFSMSMFLHIKVMH